LLADVLFVCSYVHKGHQQPGTTRSLIGGIRSQNEDNAQGIANGPTLL